MKSTQQFKKFMIYGGFRYWAPPPCSAYVIVQNPIQAIQFLKFFYDYLKNNLKTIIYLFLTDPKESHNNIGNNRIWIISKKICVWLGAVFIPNISF